MRAHPIFDSHTGRIGVMTNDPHYEWHLHNLNGYAAYPTTRNQAPWGLDAIETAVGTVPGGPPSHGLNTRGLPGGTTPPDRFVKMFLLREMAAAHAPPASVDEAIVVAQGLLNTVHLVRGTICLLYTSPSPRDRQKSRMPSSA